MTASFQHISVLLNESIEGLAIKPDGIYIDGTFGRGGHSRTILAQLGPEVPHGLPLTQEQIRALGSAKMKTVGKALKPSDQEVELNPRSRSSVLRVAEKL